MYDVHCHMDAISTLPTHIRGLISSGIKPSSWAAHIECAAQWPINICLGLHPFFVDDITLEALEPLSELILNPSLIAIGEIGLDYHKQNPSNRALQVEAFRYQLRLASDSSLPVIIHCRKAFDDLWPLLEAIDLCGVVFHNFSGSSGDLKRALDRGDYISFGFPITFDDNIKQRSHLAETPFDRIMLETDSPYMKQKGHETSAPDEVSLVYGSAASLKGVSLDDMVSHVSENVHKLWPRIKPLREDP